MYLNTVLIAALATVALANPLAEQQAKGPRADCNNKVYNCLLTYLNFQPTSIQSYCTSFLSISTSIKTSTSTSTSYDRIDARLLGGALLMIVGQRIQELSRSVTLLLLLWMDLPSR
jgi:hypothetical protein